MRASPIAIAFLMAISTASEATVANSDRARKSNADDSMRNNHRFLRDNEIDIEAEDRMAWSFNFKKDGLADRIIRATQWDSKVAILKDMKEGQMNYAFDDLVRTIQLFIPSYEAGMNKGAFIRMLRNSDLDEHVQSLIERVYLKQAAFGAQGRASDKLYRILS
ncbi:hypothetical protein GN244_ATG08262 [Phytophthora infestans]|uniref:Secreted RxLR effector peptide protein n=1 Tax=Phytophthora infestans TaxID=4787 RepID=A0A833TE73_PHYIN|nr:hypothetical protein GN244_ATG08262 [Phytophthora infestans]KAF4130541.1 hypothetical protein GN958_ATG20243 [Phytophthora infestans]